LSLKQKTASGFFWSAAERFSVQGLQFVIGIILARLLLPSDYGLIGMLAIFLALSQVFIDSGFSSALIQKKDRTETDFSTAFYFNIAIGLSFYLILYLLSPFIADFYNAPILNSLTKVIGLSVFINSLAVVQRAKLSIILDFKTQAKASLIAVFISGIIGISMAYNDFGVWSLAAQLISRTLINSILLWYFSKWLPKLIFSYESFKSLFSFGSKLLLAGLLYTLYGNLYLIVIGKIFNASSLGFYTRAQQFQKLTTENVTAVIQRVTFPVLSSIQDKDEQLVKIFRKFIRIATFVIFPITISLAVLAEPVIEILLTEKWLPTVPLLQLLCIVGILHPLHAINLNIINVKGRSDIFLKLEIIKTILTTIAIAITFSYGIKALIYGQLITSVLTLIITMYFSGKMISYHPFKQFKDLMPIAIITALMAVAVHLSIYSIDQNWLKLMIGVLAGIITYAVAAKIGRFEEIKQILSLIKSRII